MRNRTRATLLICIFVVSEAFYVWAYGWLVTLIALAVGLVAGVAIHKALR